MFQTDHSRIPAKHLQREAPQKSAELYAERYRSALVDERDRFLSEMYLDELAHSLILAESKEALTQTAKRDAQSINMLEREVRALVGELSEDVSEAFEEDLALCLSKRYPGALSDVDSLDNTQPGVAES